MPFSSLSPAARCKGYRSHLDSLLDDIGAAPDHNDVVGASPSPPARERSTLGARRALRTRRSRGWGFLGVEFPGYGLSRTGFPTEESINWAARRALKGR